MKKNILAGVACTALLWSFTTSCSEESSLVGTDAGRIALDIDFNADPLTARDARTSRATGSILNPITVDDLSLKLTSTEREFSKSWGSLSEFDTNEDFPTGNYLFEATYGKATDEGYGKPYYYGSQSVTVRNEQTTNVSMTVSLANSIVDVKYTDEFKNFMSTYSSQFHSAGGQYFDHNENATEELYVMPGEVALNVTFTKPNGKSATVEAAKFTARPRYRHTVTVGIEGDGYGDAQLTLSFDDTVENEEYTIDISDDILTTAAPTLTPDGFTDGENIAMVETAAASDIKMNVVARGEIASVTLTTSSTSLLKKGWPAEVDLANVDATTKSKLQALGLNTLGIWNNPQAMGVIDFTKVLSNIAYVEGDSNISTFTVTVKDKMSKVSEPLSFSVTVDRLTLAITNGEVNDDTEELTLDVMYNGGDFEKSVIFEANNDRGTTDKLVVKSIIPGSEPNTYKVVLTNLPAEVNPVIVTATVGSIKSEPLSVKRRPFNISATDGNVWAKKATIDMAITHADYVNKADAAQFYLSTDGNNFTAAPAAERQSIKSRALANVSFLLSGLTPATKYYVKAKIDEDESSVITFTTEAADQFPNSEMENWYSEQAYGKKAAWVGETDIKRWFPNASGDSFWATRNPLTTGQTSGTTCFYTSFSSTISVSGNNGLAAEISTLGYGEGTTYTHTSSGKTGNPKHKKPGMLFVGDYSCSGQNETITYGKPFTSRPSALSFNYKYTPVNNENFKAYIVIENRDNGTVTELARGEFESNEAKSSFTPHSIELTYSNTSLKATHAYAVFVSSTEEANPTVLSRQGSKGTFNGYSDSKYVGSQLTIDDIQLIY